MNEEANKDNSPAKASLEFDLTTFEGEKRLRDAVNSERYRVALQEIDSQLYYMEHNSEDYRRASVAKDIRKMILNLIQHYNLQIDWMSGSRK